MKLELESTAWSIVDGLNKLIADEESLNALEKTEIARLASLTYAVRNNDLFSDYEFSSISFEADRFGVSHSDIKDSVLSYLDSFKGPSLGRVSTNEMVSLLKEKNYEVHSIFFKSYIL